MPLTTIPLPYGLRDLHVRGYTTAAATALNPASIDFPYARTMAFAEAEEYEELRGDDKVVTTRGRGPQVEWEIEGGGFSYEAYAAIAGGTITDSGVTPAQKRSFKKKGTDSRPFFQAEGQSISDSGGDFHGVLFRCRATGNLEGTMADGAFWLTGISGVALPSFVVANLDDLYEFVQNETAVAITP